MSFHYALVARGTTPLAEYSLISGNYRSIALKMLESIDPKTPVAIVEQGKSVFYSLTDSDRITFLCLCDSTVVATLRSSFVEELQRKWRQKYGNSAAGFAPNSKNQEFGQTEIATLLRSFNSERNAKLAQAKQNLQETQDKMTQNLTMAFARGEQLNIMEQKAENIKDSAQTFHREATNVRRKMCLQKWRWYFLGAGIVLVVIFIIVVIACGGFTFKKCK
ncbi:Synaptobrevin family protein [Tritrichomonas foetus]|uniref:Synaptobrevin family protein n=1 Tax=Tritrichomonas foetus TaxID=1144522 RepID=A0A1J4JPZ9_9EUKA|nr:Synaptobrevin family protein [Tritrichomonas foetus]|eukprot:OHT00496.1 Synaptobrevin family protein [Tritrichomonas foetus]